MHYGKHLIMRKKSKPIKLASSIIVTAITLSACSPSNVVKEATSSQVSEVQVVGSTLTLNSLNDLSVESLRSRNYSSTLKIEKLLSTTDTDNDYTKHYFSSSTQYHTYLASYPSDDLTIYTRVDVPNSPMPEQGYPVVMFIHGWIGMKNAPSYDFNYKANTNYADVIDNYVKAGFIVLTPGLRGHGTVNGIAAQGIDYMARWDNPTYLSPVFYTIDALNLLSGISSLEQINWLNVNEQQAEFKVNTNNINITGHSQGGDVVLTALAVSGEGSTITTPFNAGSIWAGCFLPPLEQSLLYGPMGNTTDAFLSGDGTWTASAVGKNGEINHNFRFAYPADWIGTPDNSANNWTWQKDTWSVTSVKESLISRFNTMYDTLNAHVHDIDNVTYNVRTDNLGKVELIHEQSVLNQYRNIGGFNSPQYLTEPIALHHSDRDYYSPSIWNERLVNKINALGGQATNFEYVGNTHSLKVSDKKWFSPPGTEAGFEHMMERNIALFSQ